MAAWVEATSREMGQSLINPDKPSDSASALPGDTEKPEIGPKAHLMPKPFSLQRNATVRSIRAPKTNFNRQLQRATSSDTLLNTTDTRAGGVETSDSNGTVNGSYQSAAPKPVPLRPKPDLQAKPKPELTKSPDITGSKNQTGPNSKPDVTAEDIKNVQHRSRAKSLGSQDQKILNPKAQGEAAVTEADVKVPSRCWPARNRLSMQLTSKFESPSQEVNIVRSKTEKEGPPRSPSAVSESKSSKPPVEKEEEGDEEVGGGSIKRRISLLFDRSAASQRRDTFNKKDITPAEISIDIKQRIQNLSLPSTGAPKSPPFEKTNERSSERPADSATEKDKPPNTTEIKNSGVENAEEKEDDGVEEDKENYVAVPVYQRVGISIDAEKKRKEEEEKQRKDEQLEKERRQQEKDRLLEEERKAKEIQKQQEEERKQEEEKQRQMEERKKQEEEWKRRLEEERKEEERRIQAEKERERQRERERLERERQIEEEKRRIEKERQREEERLRQEKLKKEKEMEEERRRIQELERQKEEERIRKEQERERIRKEKEMEEERRRIQEMERQKEEGRLRQEREKEERLKKEREMEEEKRRVQEMERQKEEERLRQEREKEERLKKEREMEEERRRVQEMERQKEEERLRKEQEMERIRKEKEMEEERLKEEERLRQQREKEERFKKEREMEEERRRIQEMERQKEEERLRKEQEMERIRKEKEMEEERQRIQEMERQKKEEKLRQEREKEERLKKEREMEEKRLKEEERLRQEREKEERLKKERETEEKRLKEEERLRQEREKEERLKKEREMEEERLKEEERLRQEREKEERLKKEREMEEERRRIQELERQKEEEKMRKEREMERIRKERDEERLKEEERLKQEREKEERLKKEREMEEERRRVQDMERQKEEERLRKEREMERIKKERETEERKRMEEQRQREEEERLRQEGERLKKEMEMEACKSVERLQEEVPTSYDLISFNEEEPAASPTLVSAVSPQLTEVIFDDFSVKPRRWGTGARRSSTPSPSREPLAASDHNLQPEAKSNDPGSQEPHEDQVNVDDLIGLKPEASSPQNSSYKHTESREQTSLSEEETESKPEDLLVSEIQSDEGQLKDCEPEEDGVSELDTENLIDEADEQTENNDTVDDVGTESRINLALQRLTQVRQRNKSTDSDRSDVPAEEEPEPLPVLESAAPLLDSSVFRSKVDLAKKRSIKRSRPTRAVRQRDALPALTEGTNPDWRFCDSTDAKDQRSNGGDSESEEEPSRDVTSPPAPSQPKRVPMFPGINPLALMAQFKRRSGVVEADSPPEAQTPPSVPTRSPRTPTMALGPRVLPPVDAKDSGSGSSPSWLLELKSKKRTSQPESEA